MSQQAPDLRGSMQIVRRHKRLVGIVLALGLLVGGGYAALNPPMLTSTALIVLPQAVQNAPSAQNPAPSTNAITQYMATQVVIAGSTPVLVAALPNVRPAMSLNQLRTKVQVAGLTSYIISVEAQGRTAADAEATADAVAQSYISYVNAASSPIGHVSARILEAPTTATGTKPLEALLITGLVGALAGALVGIIVSLAVSRKDKRLRERDEMANSIGVPILASVPVARPSDATHWARLLEDYEPAPVHAWRLRKALEQLGVVGGFLRRGDDNYSFSVAVLSLSSDPRALALGPQLAVFAASLGIPTTLIIGPQQDVNATAALRTACTGSASPKRSSRLRVAVHDGSDVDEQPGGGFTVIVAVVDSRNPKITDMMRTTTTVIGVSAGSATAEQLARVAVASATDGREVSGILLADPEPTDNTTGRIPHLAQPTQHRRPRRFSGVTTEIRR